MIPSITGAAKAIGLVLPHLKGKLNGFAMRVPTPNVSVVDLVANTRKPVTAESVNNALKEAAHGALKHVLGFCELPLVSRGLPLQQAVLDSRLRTDHGRQRKTWSKSCAWYDNEWGYSNRLIELAGIVANKLAVKV